MSFSGDNITNEIFLHDTRLPYLFSIVVGPLRMRISLKATCTDQVAYGTHTLGHLRYCDLLF